jgi:hypothetical protein
MAVAASNYTWTWPLKILLQVILILCWACQMLAQSASLEDVKSAILQRQWEEARAAAWSYANDFMHQGEVSSATRAVLLCARIPPATSVPPQVLLTAGQMLCNQGKTRQGAGKLRNLIRRGSVEGIERELLAAAYAALGTCMMEERNFAIAAASFRQSLNAVPAQVGARCESLACGLRHIISNPC